MLEQTTTCVENDDVDDESRSSLDLAYKPFHESLFEVNLIPKKDDEMRFDGIYLFLLKNCF